MQLQWSLDLTKCQGTGKICSLYRTPPFNEFSGMFANTEVKLVIDLQTPAFPDLKKYCNHISVPGYTELWH